MGAMASQITSLTIVYSTVYSGAHQRKHQSSASLAFVRGTHRWPVNFPHKGPVTRKRPPFDDVIMMDQLFDRPCDSEATLQLYVNISHESTTKSKQNKTQNANQNKMVLIFVGHPVFPDTSLGVQELCDWSSINLAGVPFANIYQLRLENG